ncbi:MAG TPA: sigma-54 dependent transcriptional regulator [Bryobacteraceae bacterium]|nr:sigma-54 dependent transcriptional regulator [Bryobacteraceae bacterium]
MQTVEPPRLLYLSVADSVEFARMSAALEGFELAQAPGVPEAVEYLKRASFDAAVLCCPLAEWTPAEALLALQQAEADVPVVVWDPQTGVADAVRLTRLGAIDVIADSRPEQLAAALSDAVERRSRPPRQLTAAEPWRENLVGSSQAFQEVVRLVRLVADRRSTVLITGESGTGKEMAARAIHMAGPRGRRPMVAVCCSALPENLLEAELFGHVRGAFTGAVAHRIGRFEQAEGSTIFLDEIGEMPLDLQAKLLRVLQEREFQRLGSSETIHVDVRVVAATNADLRERVRQGRFREDLYYRLNVVPIELPPLRARPGDVAALTQHFIRKICEAENLPLRQISGEALRRLNAYAWPGNVRQLENAIERAIVLSGARTVLYPADFPLDSERPRPLAERAAGQLVQVPDAGLDFEQTVGQIARSIIEQALHKTNGNKKMAADLLGLKRTTLAAKLRSLEAGESELASMAADFVHNA